VFVDLVRNYKFCTQILTSISFYLLQTTVYQSFKHWYILTSITLELSNLLIRSIPKMPQFFDETKERLILKAEDVSKTLVYEATHFRSSAKRRWRSANAKKRRFKRKLMELLRIADRGDPEYNNILYKSAEDLQAIAYGRMQDLRCGFPPLYPDEIYANPNAIRSPFTQYPPSSLTTPESIFNRLYCGEPCPSHPPNMMYSPSGNWLFNPYMKNFRQELVCPKPIAKHQKSESHKPKKYQNSDSRQPKAKPNNAVYDNRQRPKPSAQDLTSYYKPKPTPIDSVSGHKSKSMSSIESSAKRSFESFKSVVTAETDATQVSSKTGSKKENFNVAAAKLDSQIEISKEPVKKDAAKVDNINNNPAVVGTVPKVEIPSEAVIETALKKAPKEVHQKATKVGATKFEAGKAASSSKGSKIADSRLIIADKTAILEAKLVRENDRYTKGSKLEIRVDVAKEIANAERNSKVAEIRPVPKVERNDSQNYTDLVQEISMMIVQGADEYVLSRSECLKANTKNTPNDIEKTIPEPTNDLSSKQLDAKTQRFNNHRAKYFADRERKIVNHKKRGYAPGSLFRISHGKYLRDVYERQMEIIGLDSSVKDFLANKLQEELKTAQIIERELTKSEMEGLLEKIVLGKNEFNEGVHPQVIKDDGSRILFRSPLASLYYNNREYQEFDQWLCFQIEESKLLTS